MICGRHQRRQNNSGARAVSLTSPLSYPSGKTMYTDFTSPLSAFCVTLYNEKRSAVAATLRSITAAVDYCYRHDPSLERPSVLCLIADRRNAVDPELLTWLGTTGMLNPAPVRLSDTELHCQASPNLHTIVCIKDSNLGKLHSHALFFGTLCQQMRPQFCFQVDAGSTLKPDIVLKLIHRLRDRPDVAAVAPRVMPAAPAADVGFLAHWQYADFAGRKGVLWPFELATGHLGVIPGQTCVLRWRALRTAQSEDATTGMADPLTGYLSGGDRHGCLARLMYLAEDRVIGNQLVLASDREWKLDYDPDACAETDSCTGLSELLRQRRRWNNSEMASRWWLLSQLPGTMRRTDRSAAQNRRFALAVFAQAALALREFLLPAQFVAILAVLFPWSATPPGGLVAMLPVAWLITAGAWVLAECLAAIKRDPAPTRAARRLCRILHWASTGLFVAAALLALPLPCTIVLLAPTLYLLGMGLVLPRAGLLPAAQARLFHLPHLAVATALSCYSFWNLHDASWGTKGLRTVEASVECRSRLRRWRNIILCIWLAANGGAITAALRLHGLLATRLNPVAELFAALDGLLVVVSLWYLIARRVMRPHSHKRRRSLKRGSLESVNAL
jgi:chitin synthase